MSGSLGPFDAFVFPVRVPAFDGRTGIDACSRLAPRDERGYGDDAANQFRQSSRGARGLLNSRRVRLRGVEQAGDRRLETVAQSKNCGSQKQESPHESIFLQSPAYRLLPDAVHGRMDKAEKRGQVQFIVH